MFHGVFVANLCGCSPRSLKSGDWLRRGFIPTLSIDSLRIVALPQVLGLTHASLLEYFEEEMIAFERQGLNGQTVQVGTGRNLSGLPTNQAQPTVAWYKNILEMLRSHPSSVFVLKFYAPLILFGGTFLFWSARFRWAQLIVLVPLIFGILFYAPLAILEIPDGMIRYRRLLRWRKIGYEEIVESGTSWAVSGIGYLRLKRFVFPWGKLYFVLDQSEKLFGRGPYPLLRYIQKRVDG